MPRRIAGTLLAPPRSGSSTVGADSSPTRSTTGEARSAPVAGRRASVAVGAGQQPAGRPQRRLDLGQAAAGLEPEDQLVDARLHLVQHPPAVSGPGRIPPTIGPGRRPTGPPGRTLGPPPLRRGPGPGGAPGLRP